MAYDDDDGNGGDDGDDDNDDGDDDGNCEGILAVENKQCTKCHGRCKL